MARVALALVMLLALGGPASARVSEQPLVGHPPVSGTQNAARMGGISSLSNLEQQLVVAVNHQRVRRGLVPLRISRQLSVAARGHSLSMRSRRQGSGQGRVGAFAPGTAPLFCRRVSIGPSPIR